MDLKRFREKLRYRFDTSMTHGTPALVGWLALISLGVILTAATVIALLGIGPAGDAPMGFGEGLWASLMRTLDPGTMGGDTGWGLRAVMLTVTITGIFLVSALIGILSSGLDTKLDELRKGRSRVLERDHTVIYNWSPSIFDVISEVAVANESRRRPRIVILADRDKVEMEDEIARKAGRLGRTRVVCRTGDPTDLHDIGIANPQAARSVVILSPEGADDPDSNVIKTLLALVNDPGRRPEPYQIAAEIRDGGNAEVARVVGGREVQLVLADELIARIIVQSTRQPGLSAVFSDLLDFDGSEIYTIAQPALDGLTFGEALMAYDTSSLIGLCDADGRVRLNPPMDTPFAAGTKAILIAEDDSTIAVTDPRHRPPVAALESPPAPVIRPERVLIIGWNRRGPLIVRELASYVAPGSVLTVAASSDGIADDIAHLPASDRLAIDLRTVDTGRRSAIEALDPGSYDHILVLGYSSDLAPQAADTRTLVTLLYLRQIGQAAGRRINVVSEMIDVRNRELAEMTDVNDFVVSNKLVSLMLAQASEDPYLEAIFAELLTAEGSEICFRPAAAYVPAGPAVTFHQIADAARRAGEIAIGYDRKASGLVLNPDRREALDYAPGDRVIVLAEG